MRAVLQRVSTASVRVGGVVISHIEHGLLVLLGVEEADTDEDIAWLCSKIANLRIFNDDINVMNLSIKDVGGNIIVVSQFTLHAATKKGNRPSYIKAARPEVAEPLYEAFVKRLSHEISKVVQTGIFGADMKVSLINDGPVTITIDTKNRE
jgi:D-tyrosyl-tRNA(Tyr) deacylase